MYLILLALLLAQQLLAMVEFEEFEKEGVAAQAQGNFEGIERLERQPLDGSQHLGYGTLSKVEKIDSVELNRHNCFCSFLRIIVGSAYGHKTMANQIEGPWKLPPEILLKIMEYMEGDDRALQYLVRLIPPNAFIQKKILNNFLQRSLAQKKPLEDVLGAATIFFMTTLEPKKALFHNFDDIRLWAAKVDGICRQVNGASALDLKKELKEKCAECNDPLKKCLLASLILKIEMSEKILEPVSDEELGRTECSCTKRGCVVLTSTGGLVLSVFLLLIGLAYCAAIQVTFGLPFLCAGGGLFIPSLGALIVMLCPASAISKILTCHRICIRKRLKNVPLAEEVTAQDLV